jgi:RNA polymerase sigma-70 factor (ECF subfamily)
MNDVDGLAERFEANRAHLRAVAYRMLGSLSEADDAVQESWLRLHRTDTSDVENLGGWLTTVVARVCLDVLRSRRSRREEAWDETRPDPAAAPGPGVDPEREALLADSVGLALLVVLETLAPAERLAFVLHDLFAVPFDEIAPIVGRTPAATRQLASRARRRVQGAELAPDDLVSDDVPHQRAVVEAFLAAARGGDFDALVALLDPDVVLRVDRTAAEPAGTSRLARGAANVAKRASAFSGRSRFAQTALVNGAVGIIAAPGGRLRTVLAFTIVDGKIIELDLIADPERLSGLDLAVLE